MKNWQKKINCEINSIKKAVENHNVLSIERSIFHIAVKGIQEITRGNFLIVTSDLTQTEEIKEAIESFDKLLDDNTNNILVPGIQNNTHSKSFKSHSARSRVCNLALTETGAFISSIMGLLAPVPDPNKFKKQTLELRLNDDCWPPEKLSRYLVSLNYDNESQVYVPGEYSRRGGIFDFYSPAHTSPVRIEYFGDVIESLRLFDPQTQRSKEEIEQCQILSVDTVDSSSRTEFCLFDYFDESSLTVIFCEIESIKEHLIQFGHDSHLDQLGRILDSRCKKVFLIDNTVETKPADHKIFRCRVNSLSHLSTVIHPENRDCLEQLHYDSLMTYVKDWIDEGYEIVICSEEQGIFDLCNELLGKEYHLKKTSVSYFNQNALTAGMMFCGSKIVLLTEAELFGRTGAGSHKVKSADYKIDNALQSGWDLGEGDLAVHAAYGICRFLGLSRAEFQNGCREVLTLEFDNNVKIYVPLDQIYLVSRYIGAKKKVPKLSKVNGVWWKKATLGAVAAVSDLAAELIQVQAERKSLKGYSFKQASPEEVRSFTAFFPYSETKDQQTTIVDVLNDMDKPQPMDRLICGDVGFGKTEVAMRAAYKSICCGKQVVVLAPTTVLVQQHYLTFTNRFKPFPVLIDLISRFRTKKEQREIVAALFEKKIDIVIGTHRLLQPDVKFADLGLIIIDEEQRFGVSHKERLKRLRSNVDVLTLSATPIPRTLYFSMSGLRDLSTIMTPPNERLPVSTIVTEFDLEIIKNAIMQEVQRSGQVYFLHNRIHSINQRRESIAKLLPGIKIDIAHGQMEESELEAVMLRFMNGKIDVLVSTTIVESGLDIQNANTIIIERADRYGLAELYQLRGRVGRYHRQAYAYLLVPKHDLIIDAAKERLTAITKYTQLGSGIKLAMRDLEIRGAGNILGAEQSGHISAIGFNLYCQLLKEAVARIKDESFTPQTLVNFDFDFNTYDNLNTDLIQTVISSDYIQEDELRLNVYRDLSSLESLERLNQFKLDLKDRYGRMPESAVNYLKLVKLKISAQNKGIRGIKITRNKVTILMVDNRLSPNHKKSYFLKSQDKKHYLDELFEIISSFKLD